MKKKSLDEMIVAAQNINLNLPAEITYHKDVLSDGRYGYIFRHSELGQLGRLLFIPHSSGGTQLVSEVSGDIDDPATLVRRRILEPITRQILEIMGVVCGNGTGEIEPYNSPKDERIVESMLYPCEICDKTVAMLVFAENAYSSADLEDYARMMHTKAKELGVPTWIISEESENIVNGEDLRKSLVLKIYPTKENATVMTPDEVMDEVDYLMNTHCRKLILHK